MPLAVLGLGGNLGNREENLADALDLLEASPGVAIERLSCIYETEPFDVLSEQPKYLNCCVLIDTTASPQQLLRLCHEIEQALGRVRESYHGARTIDLDILLYEGVKMQTETLTLPHPGILQRAFVMIPLADLFPSHNALGLHFSESLNALDPSGVTLYK